MFFGSGSVTLRFSAFFGVSQPDLLPCPPATQASWALCERGWGEQGGRIELRQGVIEEGWFPPACEYHSHIVGAIYECTYNKLLS